MTLELLEHARPLLEEAPAAAERENARADSATGSHTPERPSGELAVAHHTVGQVARLQARLAHAARHYREALRIGTALGESSGVTEPFQGFAAVAIASRDPQLVELGVRWLAAYQQIREQMGGGPPPEWLRLGDPLADAREILSDSEYAKAWQEGLEMTADSAFADAIEVRRRLAKPVGAGAQ